MNKPVTDPTNSTKSHSQNTNVLDLRNNSNSSETVTKEFNSLEVSDEQKRKNRDNHIAAFLAVTCWLFFLGSIGYNQYRINHYADLIIQAESDKKISQIEKAKEISKDYANTINTVLGTLTGSITAYYLSAKKEENNQNDDQ